MMIRTPTATLKDVAEAAGVSLTTVSQSLSGKGNVSEETRLKVVETAESLGYRRTVSQRASVKSQLLSIGLTFDISASTNHNWRYLRSFIEECQNNIVEKGGSFLLIPYNHAITEEENIRCITKANIRGMISFSLYSQSFLSALEKQGVPVVVYNDARAHNQFLNVALDDFQSTLDAINYLIQLGHRSIMFAYTERHNLPDLSNNRFFAYKKALGRRRYPLPGRTGRPHRCRFD
jgi:DNA-binding LacI/PurR family transcriptional regulator